MNVFSNKFGKFGKNILCAWAKVPSILHFWWRALIQLCKLGLCLHCIVPCTVSLISVIQSKVQDRFIRDVTMLYQ